MKNTILITGASSGIGKATAVYFADKGWNVIATMRSPNDDFNRRDNVLVTALDVQQPESIRVAVQSGIKRFGSIDLLVNNAGYGEFGIFEATPDEQVKTQFGVNVFGVMDTIRTLLPHFREQKSGMIINISSGAGRFTLPMLSLYCASKFALEGFSEALSFELSALNIKVKIVEPGGTTTNFSKVSEGRFSGTTSIADYDKFTAGINQMFDSMRAMKLAEAEEVAATIYQAATDGTDTLRYIIGNEDFRKRIANRLTMNDDDYLNSVKGYYAKFI